MWLDNNSSEYSMSSLWRRGKRRKLGERDASKPLLIAILLFGLCFPLIVYCVVKSCFLLGVWLGSAFLAWTFLRGASHATDESSCSNPKPRLATPNSRSRAVGRDQPNSTTPIRGRIEMRTQTRSASPTSNCVDGAPFSREGAGIVRLSVSSETMSTQCYLTDERWALIASRLHGKEGDPGCHARDNRLFIEAVLWIVRADAPWRRLPPQFGRWYTIYTRYHRWAKKGLWPEVISALKADENCEYFYEDGAIRYKPAERSGAKETEATQSRGSGNRP